MRELWRAKTPEKEIEYWSHGSITQILPYERLYETLTREELLELIRDAKRLHWQALDLHKCGLDELPEELGELSDLRVLDAGNGNWGGSDKFRDGKKNTFIRVPDSIGNLCKLEELWLYSTGVTSLPESFGILTSLQWLDLTYTPLYKKLPPEYQEPIYLDNECQDVIRYILETQTSAQRYFNEAKMVVVGQGSVGKSCLINRLIHKQYENKHSTEGIAIEPWTFSGADAGLSGKGGQEQYRLNVWDFGGQEIYHATHQFFLTRRTLYVLMWDALTEDDYGRRDYWMRTIRSFAEDSPVMIVVNKCDKDSGRRHETEYAFLDRYPQIVNRDHVFYVSCRDNIGIDELRTYLLSQAVGMPLMKTKWLEKWLNVRKELETLSGERKYIFYDQYREICGRHGVMDGQEARMLAQYLHDLGVVIHYHEDELLCGIVILSPQWGTQAVYKVLDEQQRQLKGRNGILYYSDLPEIWENRNLYPRAMYPYLLKLMEKFQLAFPVDNPRLPKNTYLVAELLSENPTDYKWPPKGTEPGAEPLAFRYRYDFMPAGVMTRLIVSIHQKLVDVDGEKQCWRKGAYLAHGSARARMVLYDGVDDKYLDIRVTGESARDRSELLTIAREHIRGINSRFKKIEITELVPCRCSPGCPHFFKYETLLKAEVKERRTVECPESLDPVSVELLMGGVEKTREDEVRKAQFSGNTINIHGDMYGDMPIGSAWNAEKISVKREAVKPPEEKNEENGNEMTPVEKSEFWKNVVEALTKIPILFILLALIAAVVFLLSTGVLTLPDVVNPFLGNLPG